MEEPRWSLEDRPMTDVIARLPCSTGPNDLRVVLRADGAVVVSVLGSNETATRATVEVREELVSRRVFAALIALGLAIVDEPIRPADA